MCLRLLFLLTTRLAAWPRLSQREETWKTAEILILRHQIAVLQRRQPRRPNLNWADRALLATLLSLIPKARPRIRLLDWSHRTRSCAGTATSSAAAGPPGRARQVRPACHPPEHQGSRSPAGPREPRMGLPQGPRRVSGLGAKIAASTVREILENARIDPPRGARGRPGPSSCVLRLRHSLTRMFVEQILAEELRWSEAALVIPLGMV